MTDVVDSATRSRMMSGIKGKNTSPELLIRKALHAKGFRFRIHVKHLPRKPDLVFPKYKAVVFIHGCFWHGHDCRYFKIPKTRTDFWLDKIKNNRTRDSAHESDLLALGWRVIIVWECAIRFSNKSKSTALIDLVSEWLISKSDFFQIDEAKLKVISLEIT